MTDSVVLYLTVGLPGSGKTTLARRIVEDEDEEILRLTPDEWMAPLFRLSCRFRGSQAATARPGRGGQ